MKCEARKRTSQGLAICQRTEHDTTHIHSAIVTDSDGQQWSVEWFRNYVQITTQGVVDHDSAAI